MKKLLVCGLVGAMFVASQSMIFAGVTPTVEKGESVAAVKMTAAQKVETKENTNLKLGMVKLTDALQGKEVGNLAVAMTSSMEAIELTEEERAEMIKLQQERIQEICKVLGWDYETVKDKTIDEILSGATEAEMDNLIESGVIQVMGATLAVEAEQIIEE